MLLKVCEFLTFFLKSIWFYGPGILSVVASYFLFIELSMGQDMVIQVGEWRSSFWLTIFSAVVWAFFTWYSARIVGYKKKDVGSKIPDRFHKHIPRMLGYNALVSLLRLQFLLYLP